jgi:hypothetical protein
MVNASARAGEPESERAPAGHLDSVVATQSVLPAPARPCLEHAAVSGAPPPSRQGSGGSCSEGTSIRPGHMPPISTRCARSMRRGLLLGHQTTRAGLIHSENDACRSQEERPSKSLPVLQSTEFRVPTQATMGAYY